MTTDVFDVVPTGLVGQKASDILNSVIGQMSDGIWENGNLKRFWMTANIREEDNAILVDRGYGSGYCGKTDAEVREFFAKKIVQIVKIWTEDNPEESKCEDTDVDYLSYKEHVTVADAKEVAKALRSYGKAKSKASRGSVKEVAA